MIAKLSIAAVALALAVPVLAQTTATITQGPADTCADATNATAPTANCPATKPAKLGTNIIPLASGEGQSEGEGGEGGDED